MEDTDNTKELSEDLQDVNVNECIPSSRNMPGDNKNHPSLTNSEVKRGQNGKDGLVRFAPGKCIKTVSDKQISPPPSGSPSTSSRPGHTLPPGTNKSAPQSSSSPSSLPILTTTKTQPTNGVAERPSNRNYDVHDETRDKAKSEINRKTTSRMLHSDDSSSSELETEKDKAVITSSPPTAKVTNSGGTPQAQPLGSSRLSRLRQNHLASKKKEQMKAGAMKLPELAEHSELETSALGPRQTTTTTDGSITPRESPTTGSITSVSESTTGVMSQISTLDGAVEIPPAPSDNPITPSLPDPFLKKLGLSFGSISDDKSSVDQFSEKEIESKFASLSLAFKTDKLTLDQRVSVQERARDLAEKNVDTELQGLKDAVETLSELVTDTQVRSLIQRIKQHISVLEQSAARVSSRAEVFGAVQQERRMCKAMEVMVLYTENLRRIREREQSELLEARKLLSERSGTGFCLDSDSGSNRRSMSVCGFNTVGRPTRRRSEVALPRVLGGIGSPSLSQTGNLDAKSRFQSAVASTSLQQVITTTMRRCSMEKQRSVSMSSPTSMSLSATFMRSATPSTLSVARQNGTDSVQDSCGEKADSASKVSQEEEAFRKGFEEGLKAKLSQELNELRDQQNSINQSLENMMDKVEQSQIKDEEYLSRPSWLETTLAIIFKIGNHILQYDWKSNKTVIRNLAGIFFLLLAIFIVFICPPVTTVDVRQFVKSP